MNSFIDFIQKKLIDEKYQNKWMVSSLSESNKFFFLLNNYWVNSYSYVSFLFNSDQIEQRGKGFEINQFMIQFTLFRRFLFEIFLLLLVFLVKLGLVMTVVFEVLVLVVLK